MSYRKNALALAIALSLLVVAPAASAAPRGVLIAPSELPAQARQRLTQDIEKVRATSPQSFERVASLRRALPGLDARKRGRSVPVGPMLRAQGPGALMPMLERLAFESDERGGLGDSAWLAWRTGLLDAVGRLRDSRAEPILRAILAGSETEFLVVKSAAAALGKLGTDPVAQKLIAMSKAPGPKKRAVLAGMGHCRRRIIAERLAEALDAHPKRALALDLARALGDVGSAWAWRTPEVRRNGEEQATRDVAAEALVRAFAVYAEPVRRMLTRAILVVDHPSTLALIEAQKRGASDEVQKALDRLARRVRQSPLR